MGRMFGSSLPASLGEKLLRVPWGTLAVAALIAGIGTATLYSVSGGAMEPWAGRHAARFLLGAGMVLGMAMLPLVLWYRLAYPAYVLALVMLALVPLIGSEALGARRWLVIAGAAFQPSELMKLALVAALARYYQDLAPERVSWPRSLMLPVAMITLPVVLTVRQPDLGTTILLASLGLALVLLAGVSWLYAVAGGGALVAALPFVWSQLHGYQQRRIEIFLDPEKDPLGAGYHIAQSKIALGSGGLSGRGFLQGTQSQLDFVPEKHTDFIFAMFAEEWGFVGALALVVLYAVLVGLLWRSAAASGSRFGRLVASGAAVTVFVYAFVNMAMVSGLVPVVGVPLPFVSYGGTSMSTLLAALGLAFSAHVHAGARLPGPDRVLLR